MVGINAAKDWQDHADPEKKWLNIVLSEKKVVEVSCKLCRKWQDKISKIHPYDHTYVTGVTSATQLKRLRLKKVVLHEGSRQHQHAKKLEADGHMFMVPIDNVPKPNLILKQDCISQILKFSLVMLQECYTEILIRDTLLVSAHDLTNEYMQAVENEGVLIQVRLLRMTRKKRENNTLCYLMKLLDFYNRNVLSRGVLYAQNAGWSNGILQCCPDPVTTLRTIGCRYATTFFIRDGREEYGDLPASPPFRLSSGRNGEDLEKIVISNSKQDEVPVALIPSSAFTMPPPPPTVLDMSSTLLKDLDICSDDNPSQHTQPAAADPSPRLNETKEKLTKSPLKLKRAILGEIIKFISSLQCSYHLRIKVGEKNIDRKESCTETFVSSALTEGMIWEIKVYPYLVRGDHHLCILETLLNNFPRSGKGLIGRLYVLNDGLGGEPMQCSDPVELFSKCGCTHNTFFYIRDVRDEISRLPSPSKSCDSGPSPSTSCDRSPSLSISCDRSPSPSKSCESGCPKKQKEVTEFEQYGKPSSNVTKDITEMLHPQQLSRRTYYQPIIKSLGGTSRLNENSVMSKRVILVEIVKFLRALPCSLHVDIVVGQMIKDRAMSRSFQRMEDFCWKITECTMAFLSMTWNENFFWEIKVSPLCRDDQPLCTLEKILQNMPHSVPNSEGQLYIYNSALGKAAMPCHQPLYQLSKCAAINANSKVFSCPPAPSSPDGTGYVGSIRESPKVSWRTVTYEPPRLEIMIQPRESSLRKELQVTKLKPPGIIPDKRNGSYLVRSYEPKQKNLRVRNKRKNVDSLGQSGKPEIPWLKFLAILPRMQDNLKGVPSNHTHNSEQKEKVHATQSHRTNKKEEKTLVTQSQKSEQKGERTPETQSCKSYKKVDKAPATQSQKLNEKGEKAHVTQSHISEQSEKNDNRKEGVDCVQPHKSDKDPKFHHSHLHQQDKKKESTPSYSYELDQREQRVPATKFTVKDKKQKGVCHGQLHTSDEEDEKVPSTQLHIQDKRDGTSNAQINNPELKKSIIRRSIRGKSVKEATPAHSYEPSQCTQKSPTTRHHIQGKGNQRSPFSRSKGEQKESASQHHIHGKREKKILCVESHKSDQREQKRAKEIPPCESYKTDKNGPITLSKKQDKGKMRLHSGQSHTLEKKEQNAFGSQLHLQNKKDGTSAAQSLKSDPKGNEQKGKRVHSDKLHKSDQKELTVPATQSQMLDKGEGSTLDVVREMEKIFGPQHLIEDQRESETSLSHSLNPDQVEPKVTAGQNHMQDRREGSFMSKVNKALEKVFASLPPVQDQRNSETSLGHSLNQDQTEHKVLTAQSHIQDKREGSPLDEVSEALEKMCGPQSHIESQIKSEAFLGHSLKPDQTELRVPAAQVHMQDKREGSYMGKVNKAVEKVFDQRECETSLGHSLKPDQTEPKVPTAQSHMQVKREGSPVDEVSEALEEMFGPQPLIEDQRGSEASPEHSLKAEQTEPQVSFKGNEEESFAQVILQDHKLITERMGEPSGRSHETVQIPINQINVKKEQHLLTPVKHSTTELCAKEREEMETTPVYSSKLVKEECTGLTIPLHVQDERETRVLPTECCKPDLEEETIPVTHIHVQKIQGGSLHEPQVGWDHSREMAEETIVNPDHLELQHQIKRSPPPSSSISIKQETRIHNCLANDPQSHLLEEDCSCLENEDPNSSRKSVEKPNTFSTFSCFEKNIRKQCQEETNQLMQKALLDLCDKHFSEYATHLNQPDLHPEYEKQYKLFMKEKRDFLNSGGNIGTLIEEWEKHWSLHMLEVCKGSWEGKKLECISTFSSEEKVTTCTALPDILSTPDLESLRSRKRSMSCMSDSPDSSRKRTCKSDDKRQLLKPDSSEVLTETNPSYQDRDFMVNPIKRVVTSSESMSLHISQKSPDLLKNVAKSLTIVEALALLNYMKDILGLTEIPVNKLYEKAVTLESMGSESDLHQILKNEETANLLSMFHEKLQNILEANTASANQKVIALRAQLLLDDLSSNVISLKKNAKSQLAVDISHLAHLTMDKGTPETIKFIETAFYENNVTVSRETLKSIYMAVIDEKLKAL